MASVAARQVSGDPGKGAFDTQTTKLKNWKIVKESFTQIQVVRRLGVNCRIETTWVKVQCSDASPELTVRSSQTEQVQQLEKNMPAESITAPESAPFGRHLTYVGNASKTCKDLDLNPYAFCAVFMGLIGIQALKDYGAMSIISQTVTAVVVWLITNDATKKPIIFLCSAVLFEGGRADDSNESSKPSEDSIDSAEAAVMTIVVVVLTIGGAGVARRMYNRWRPILAPGAPAAPAFPAPAIPAPALPAAPEALRWDVMGGLTVSPVGRHSNLTFDIHPDCESTL